MSKPITTVALCLSLLLLVACGPTQKRVTAGGGKASKPTSSVPAPPAGPDWDAMAARVPNRGLAEKALDTARRANEAFASGDKDKGLELFNEAGDLYDELEMSVRKVDDRLWEQGEFKSFQRKWDPLVKKLKRARYQ